MSFAIGHRGSYDINRNTPKPAAASNKQDQVELEVETRNPRLHGHGARGGGGGAGGGADALVGTTTDTDTSPKSTETDALCSPDPQQKRTSHNYKSGNDDVKEKSPVVKPWLICAIAIGVCILFCAGVVMAYCLGINVEETNSEYVYNLEHALKGMQHRLDLVEDRDAVNNPFMIQQSHNEYIRLVSQHELQQNLFSDHLSSQTLTGTFSDEKLVEDLESHLSLLSLDNVEVKTYTILASVADADNPSTIAVLNNTSGKVIYHEQIVCRQSNQSAAAAESPLHPSCHPYVAYSPSGIVEADLVYANYGEKEDLSLLAKHGIPLQHRMVLIRTGKIPIAKKMANCAAHNVSAVLIFVHPSERGDSLCDDQTPYLSVDFAMGDPFTPGLPALDGVWRLPLSETSLPLVPVQTVSCNTAQLLVNQLQGQRAPRSWARDTFPVVHMGRRSAKSGEVKVRLETKGQLEPRKVINVVATVTGWQSPDQVVMVTANRNSFGVGVHGGAVGSASLLELVKRIPYLVEQTRWRPKRTILFCFWGGGEFGNLGMKEYLEENEELLRGRVVAYLDLDRPVLGEERLEAFTTASLTALVNDVIEHQVGDMLDMYDVMEESGSGPIDGDNWRLLDEVEVTDVYSVTSLRSGPVDLLRDMGFPVLSLGFAGSSTRDPGAAVFVGHGGCTPSEWVKVGHLLKVNARLMLALADAGLTQHDAERTLRSLRALLEDACLHLAEHVDNRTTEAALLSMRQLEARAADLHYVISGHVDYGQTIELASLSRRLVQTEHVLNRASVLLARLSSLAAGEEGAGTECDGPHPMSRGLSKVIAMMNAASNLMKTPSAVMPNFKTTDPADGHRDAELEDYRSG